MKNCKNCKTTLSSILIFKSFWKGYKSFSCKGCQAQYEFNVIDRIIGSIVILFSTFFCSSIMNYCELEIVTKLLLGFFVMILSNIILSALSITLFTFRLIKK